MIRGEEGDVPWEWTNNLTVGLFDARRRPIAQVAAHELHSRDVSGYKGNLFYGNFTLVMADGSTYTDPNGMSANPTQDQHTEPQYFEWLKGRLAALDGRPVAAIILEINQTNTPCSGKHCRPHIIGCVRDNQIGIYKFSTVLARMSAFQIYEHQYPKICPTSFEIKDARSVQMPVCTLTSMCLHRFPEKA